jgi:hypothetical protein
MRQPVLREPASDAFYGFWWRPSAFSGRHPVRPVFERSLVAYPTPRLRLGARRDTAETG